MTKGKGSGGNYALVLVIEKLRVNNIIA
jgi:hypothetical protein